MPVYSITLDEAVQKALEVSLVVKEQDEVVKRSRYAYISTIDAFLPKVTLTGSYTRYLAYHPSRSTSVSSSTGSAYYDTSKQTYTFLGVASLRVFDGGERFARRKGSFYLLERERERLKGAYLEIVYLAKTKFFAALGRRDIAEKRKEALAANKKIYDLTKARYDEGIVMKSDLLQSEVRVSTARVELYNAEKDYEKSLEDLKSFLFLTYDKDFHPQGNLTMPSKEFQKDALIERAGKIRPDIKAQQNEVDRLNMAFRERVSDWFPKVDAQLSSSRREWRFFPGNNENTFMVNFSFPLFDGVGRYYNMEAAASDVRAARYRMQETKRTAELEVTIALTDYEQGRKNVHMSEELLREATSNFNQAYGEYQHGKGDILSLLLAERELARAKENLTTATYIANSALANVERVAFLEHN